MEESTVETSECDQRHVFMPLRMQAFNDWMRIAPDKEQQITEIVQMLHNASLMYVRLCVLCVCMCIGLYMPDTPFFTDRLMQY